MPDTNDEKIESTEDEKKVTEETTDGEQPKPEEGEDGDKPEVDEDDDKAEELPEWARKKLSKANTEAANYRTQLRALQEKFEGAKTPEEFETATRELAEHNANLEVTLAKEKALRVHGLEEADLIFLTATKAEDIEAQAKALAARLPAAAPDPKDLKGGLDPNDEDTEPTDPGALARKYGRRRY